MDSPRISRTPTTTDAPKIRNLMTHIGPMYHHYHHSLEETGNISEYLLSISKELPKLTLSLAGEEMLWVEMALEAI